MHREKLTGCSQRDSLTGEGKESISETRYQRVHSVMIFNFAGLQATQINFSQLSSFVSESRASLCGRARDAGAQGGVEWRCGDLKLSSRRVFAGANQQTRLRSHWPLTFGRRFHHFRYVINFRRPNLLTTGFIWSAPSDRPAVRNLTPGSYILKLRKGTLCNCDRSRYKTKLSRYKID